MSNFPKSDKILKQPFLGASRVRLTLFSLDVPEEQFLSRTVLPRYGRVAPI